MNYPKSQRQLLVSPPKNQIGELQQYPNFKVNVEFDHERFKAIEYEFKLVDSDDNGTLSKDELQIYVQGKLGDKYSHKLFEEMFMEINTDQDDRISKDEFTHGYLTKEINLKQQIDKITQKIYEEEEQSKQLQREIDELQGTDRLEDIGIVMITVQSGTLHIDSGVSNTEKTQTQVIISLNTDNSIYTKKQKETKPSLSYEHPLWNETLNFYIRNDQKQLKFDLLIYKFYQQQKTLLYEHQYARTLNKDFQESEKIRMENFGEIDVVYDYHSSFVQWSKSRMAQLQSELKLKYDQGAILKQKQCYYKLLFGTVQKNTVLDSKIGVEALRHSIKPIAQPLVMPANLIPFQVEFNSIQLTKQTAINIYPNPYKVNYKVEQQSPQNPQKDVSYANWQGQCNSKSFIQPSNDPPKSLIIHEQEFDILTSFTNFQIQSDTLGGQAIQDIDGFNSYIQRRKIMTYLLFVVVLLSSVFRANFISFMMVIFLLPNLSNRWSSSYMHFLIYGFALSILFDGSWLFIYTSCNYLEYSTYCSLAYGVNSITYFNEVFCLVLKVVYLIYVKEFNFKF